MTADKRGDGLIVLFHVTADTTWSNLPLSGLFVDMLRRTVALAGASSDANAEARNAENETVAPRLTLDGYGIYISPPATARAVTRTYMERANGEHPPGFYGPVDSSLAVNALLPTDRLAPLNLAPLNARIAPLAGAQTIDLRMPLFMLALVLLIVDTLASLWLGGHLSNLFGRLRRAGAAAGIVLGGPDALQPGLGSRTPRSAAPP